MKALHIFGQNDIRVVNDAPIPKITDPKDVVIEVSFCGICGTDLHEYISGPILAPSPVNRINSLVSSYPSAWVTSTRVP